MREKLQLEHIVRIIESYESLFINNPTHFPLSIFLSKYYRENKQMGSRDRKQTSKIIFNYYRLGNILNELEIKERIAIANFICENTEFPLLNYIIETHTKLNGSQLNLTIEEKLELIKSIYPTFNIAQLFKIKINFSSGLNEIDFLKSFFKQPKLWVRTKNKKRDKVIIELIQNKIPFQDYDEFPNSLSFENATSLDTLETKKKGYFEIQDNSSQLVGKYFEPKDNEKWWDCCAGAGGKSLMLLDKNPNIHLTVSDKRASILNNLTERFKKSGVKNVTTKEIDLTTDFVFQDKLESYDAMIADVPCSGSGTWARTPEILTKLAETTIVDFQKTQLKIVKSILPYLKKEGVLIYITCSVFKAENEDVIDFLIKSENVGLEKLELICGYSYGADNLFVTKFIKK